MKQYYFISGLPRSGSTLLSSILKQNPDFHTGISGPMLSHFRAIFEISNEVQQSERSTARTERMLKAVVNTFYEDINKPVIFDTNRLWTNLLPQLKHIYPYTKVIVCVRDINWIINSFEMMHQKNPMNISSVYPKNVDMNVYSRTQSLMAEGGIIRLPYDSLKSAMTGAFKDMLFFVDYNLLTKNPEGTLKALYNFIGKPYFNHDFDNVENSFDEYDADLNLPGLHTVKRKVEYVERDFILPPDILNQYANLEVWK